MIGPIRLICALVVALGLGASAQQSPQEKQNPRQQDAAASQSALVRVAEPEGDREGRPNQADAEGQPSPLERSDLAAQWTMAGFAGLQVLLTFLGLLYIRSTLTETRKAVAEAAKATEAAVRSAAVAEQALVGVERPFLVIHLGRPNSNSQPYGFINYGRSPAVILHCEARYLAITPLNFEEPMKPNMLQAAITPGWNVVGPNGGSGGEDFVRLGKPIVPDAESAQMRMLHGYVMYRSLTGETFVSGFGLIREAGGPWKALAGAAFNYDERLVKGGPRKRQRARLTVTPRKNSTTHQEQ